LLHNKALPVYLNLIHNKALSVYLNLMSKQSSICLSKFDFITKLYRSI
jgi:hypothetical protein